MTTRTSQRFPNPIYQEEVAKLYARLDQEEVFPLFETAEMVKAEEIVREELKKFENYNPDDVQSEVYFDFLDTYFQAPPEGKTAYQVVNHFLDNLASYAPTVDEQLNFTYPILQSFIYTEQSQLDTQRLDLLKKLPPHDIQGNSLSSWVALQFNDTYEFYDAGPFPDVSYFSNIVPWIYDYLREQNIDFDGEHHFAYISLLFLPTYYTEEFEIDSEYIKFLKSIHEKYPEVVITEDDYQAQLKLGFDSQVAEIMKNIFS